MTTVTSGEDTSVLGELIKGRPRWDLLGRFPVQSGEDGERGDEAVRASTEFVTAWVDAVEVETTRRFPDGLFEQMRQTGLYSLGAPQDRGGLGLTPWNVFRVVHAVAGHSVPVATSMAVHMGFGAASYLPVLPDGSLRRMISKLDEAGFISGDADTEPSGAFNRRRSTTAVLDGEHYVLNGDKIFIMNAPVADLLRVSATVRNDEGESIGLFFVPTDSTGLSIGETHEFVGLRGVPVAPVRLRNVRVPREWRFEPGAGMGADEEWRLRDELTDISVRARMFAIAAPSLSIAQTALRIGREFVLGRAVDGRGLAEYSEIQRMLAETAADIFGVQALVEWCLIPADAPAESRRWEQFTVKNLSSVTCWRVVDRMMSLLAAQGLETARSQRGRGLPGLRMEQLWRDARMLRVSGGVDFLIDNWFATSQIVTAFDDDNELPEVTHARLPLNPRNSGHQDFVTREARWFAQTCRELVREHPDTAVLTARQNLMISLARLVSELFAMTLVLGKAASAGDADSQSLADVYCDSARSRVAELRHRIATADRGADYHAISERLLSDERFAQMTGADA